MSRSPYLVNRAFKTFAVSTILAVMATSLGVVVNGIIVGNMMGSAELSAVNLISPLIQLYNALTALVCVGGATLCAVLVGKGNEGESGRIFSVCMAMMLIASVVLLVLGTAAPGAVVQREDLNFIEEALGYENLIKELTAVSVPIVFLIRFIFNKIDPEVTY